MKYHCSRCFILMKTQDGLLKYTWGFILCSLLVSSSKRKSDNAIGEKQIENTSIMFYLFFSKWYFYHRYMVLISNWIRDHWSIFLMWLNLKWCFFHIVADLKYFMMTEQVLCGFLCETVKKVNRKTWENGKFIFWKSWCSLFIGISWIW